MPPEQLQPEQDPMQNQMMAQPSQDLGGQEMSPDRAMAALAFSNKMVEDNFLQPQEEVMEETEEPEEVDPEAQTEEMDSKIEKAVKKAVKDELKGIREEIKAITEEDDKEE